MVQAYVIIDYELLQIWKFPKLWVGFLKCAQLTQPQSFSVLLQVCLVFLQLSSVTDLYYYLIEFKQHVIAPTLLPIMPHLCLSLLVSTYVSLFIPVFEHIAALSKDL